MSETTKKLKSGVYDGDKPRVVIDDDLTINALLSQIERLREQVALGDVTEVVRKMAAENQSAALAEVTRERDAARADVERLKADLAKAERERDHWLQALGSKVPSGDWEAEFDDGDEPASPPPDQSPDAGNMPSDEELGRMFADAPGSDLEACVSVVRAIRAADAAEIKRLRQRVAELEGEVRAHFDQSPNVIRDRDVHLYRVAGVIK